ncbi:hypothetical protein LRAMOSA02055 [Lichtheimia ramosa]|uniref:Pectate lyase superfamily protein domain-containing protein n=1 Tax=Lichtheimia ramosa TaxID=688394 RepID=A0A077WK31_9FUNG|nr:hypothetical protein LRAMOSA02055 [Lichtheimia ramosa]
MGGFERFLRTTVGALEQLAVNAQHSNGSSSSTAHQPIHYNPVPQPTTTTPIPQYFTNAPFSSLVYPAPDGNLVYKPYTEKGDRILDFSSAGYNEGWTPLPNDVNIARILDPIPGNNDDATRIQDAINDVAKMPMNQQTGFRGAVRLNPGTYRLGHPIEINTSGIVLQGHPQGGTILEATTDPLNTPYIFKIQGAANVMAKGRVPVMDDYVPAGASQLRVRDTKRFKVGDTVLVGVAFNDTFIKAIGMDVIHPKGNTAKNNGWKPGRFDHHRRIIRIDNDIITLNAPLTTSLSKEFGGGFVEKYENHRVHHVGLEYFECRFPANRDRGPDAITASQPKNKKVKDYRFADEMFDHLMVTMDHAENCWIRQVRSVWWRNYARLGTNTVAVTMHQCHHTFPQPPSNDPKKPMPLVGQFAFEISGQLILIEHCHVEYSFHAYSYKGRVPGPNVVYRSDCVARNGDVGPHMKWSSGQLYDNCNIEGQMIIQDRFDAGSGHGWSGAHSVVWNTVAHAGMIVQKPPVGHNFLIGSSSKRAKARMPQHPWAWEEHPDTKVNPPSLYLAQLAERRRHTPPLI